MTEASATVTCTDDRATFSDYLRLLLLRAAKRRRLGQASASDEVFYNSFFEAKDLSFCERDLRKVLYYEQVARVILRLKENPTVLDVGCGLGFLLKSLPETYTKIGLEYVEKTARVAQRVAGPAAKVIVGDCTRIPLPEKSVDVVVSLEVIEHVRDDASAVREVARVLRDDGICIISVPYSHYFSQYYDLIGHYRHYSRLSLQELLHSEGLQVLQYLPNYPRFDRRYYWYYVALVIIARVWSKVVGREILPYSLGAGGHHMGSLHDRFEPLLRCAAKRDLTLDYSRLNTSTFVVARPIQ